MGLLDGAIDSIRSKATSGSGGVAPAAPSVPPAPFVPPVASPIVSQDSDYVTIDGIVNPGIIAPGGISGFKRETEWDVKKGKGTKGGTTTLSQLPPAKGSIKFFLWTLRPIRSVRPTSQT